MSVPPRRGLNRRPARGFGQKKDSSLGKAPSRLTKKKRFSISDSFKKGEERRRIRKIKREQEKKLRGTSTKSSLVVEPKKPKTPKTPKTLNKTGRRKVPGVKAPGSGTRVKRPAPGFKKGQQPNITAADMKNVKSLPSSKVKIGPRGAVGSAGRPKKPLAPPFGKTFVNALNQRAKK